MKCVLLEANELKAGEGLMNHRDEMHDYLPQREFS